MSRSRRRRGWSGPLAAGGRRQVRAPYTCRLIASTLLAVALSGCVQPPPPIADDGPVFDAADDVTLPSAAADSVRRRAQQVTVRIRALGCDRFGIGSGFVLPGGVVVTNRHVVDEPRAVSLNTWDGISLEATVEGVAVDTDLAVLRLEDDAGLPVAELRTTPIEPGERVVAVGYPDGGPATVSAGTVVGLLDGELLGEASDVIRVDATIRQGNSGGPLLDEEGRVVGVVFGLDVPSGHGLAVPIDTLLERLEGDALSAPSGDC